MVGDLCAVVLQAACLTLEDTTVIGVFLNICYFIYFKCSPIASYLCVILSKICFRTAQKTIDRQPPLFKLGDRVYFKNKQAVKWDLKWRPGYRIFHIEHNGHYLHIENQATGKTRSCNIKDVVFKLPVELWNINAQFGRAGRYINHPMNLPTIIFSN